MCGLCGLHKEGLEDFETLDRRQEDSQLGNVLGVDVLEAGICGGVLHLRTCLRRCHADPRKGGVSAGGAEALGSQPGPGGGAQLLHCGLKTARRQP